MRIIDVPALLVAITFAGVAVAQGQPWDADDFLVAGFNSNTISVFDSDFTFKGLLDSDFCSATGLDFTSRGTLVAVSQQSEFDPLTSEVREYDASGRLVGGFVHADIHLALDIKVGRGDLLYVGTQGPAAVAEFDLSGNLHRSFGDGYFSAVALVPDATLWAAEPNLPGPPIPIETFDIVSGWPLLPIELDNGQMHATSMSYSSSTETVLVVDLNGPGVFERALDGAFVRAFTAPTLAQASSVTRGPEGNVVATDFANSSVFCWHADGTFLGEHDLSSGRVMNPVGIVWAGLSAFVMPGDATGDDIVNVADLVAVIVAWGPCPSQHAECPEDLDGSGSVDVEDLGAVIVNWSG